MIEVKNLRKRFQNSNVDAVKEVSFSLEKGEIACLIGTSGCGKTTTLKMINRLVEPSSGEIKVADKYARDLDENSWRKGIGYVIQKAGLLPHLSIFENISLLAKINKKPRSQYEKRVQHLMRLINLDYTEFSTKYPHELSGGQQQRVGIARALMEDPPVLLMDEPFGALDPITRTTIHEELLELNRTLHKTILIVTHDLDEAFKLSNKIIVMNNGEVEQVGTVDEIKNNPSSQFIKDFIQSHNG